jgi:hypothetical protein
VLSRSGEVCKRSGRAGAHREVRDNSASRLAVERFGSLAWWAARVETAIDAAIAALVGDGLQVSAAVEHRATGLVMIAALAAIMYSVMTTSQHREDATSLRLSSRSEVPLGKQRNRSRPCSP